LQGVLKLDNKPINLGFNCLLSKYTYLCSGRTCLWFCFRRLWLTASWSKLHGV